MALHDGLMHDGPMPTPRRRWRRLPHLTDGVVSLRGLRAGDAASLASHLNDPRVVQYIAPAPGTIDGFRRFIRWTQAERRRDRLACFGVIPAGTDSPAGIIQVWPVDTDFWTAEWGFALGCALWGTGTFDRAARLFLDFVFSEFGVSRLEARSAEGNGRGNRVFEKLGATRDGLLRGAFRDGHVVGNHVLWSMLASEWQAQRARMRRAN